MSTQAEQGVSAESVETPEVGFQIDGERYDIPTLDTITLDEERILYLYADCVIQDFAPSHPKWDEARKAAHDLIQMQKVRNPDFKRALAHIAYRREHPDVSDSEINRALGTINALEVDLAMLGDDPRPPEEGSQNGHSKSSVSELPTRSMVSGSSTPKSSGSAA